MQGNWNDIVVKRIKVAVHVLPNTGRHVHYDRPSHGLVLNAGDSIRDYCFSDGRVMRTESGDLFYLPQNSSYHVKTIKPGGCYAINFDADFLDSPFSLSVRNAESLKKNFKTACEEWRTQSPARFAAAMRALYDAIYLIQKERALSYMPNNRHGLIAPAIEVLYRDFANRDLTVSSLASLCGISEVYFRKIFSRQFGVSPKDYIIQKRIDYAKQLLSTGEFDVSEVAILCGYCEPCHFSREFKRRAGVSPVEYRR